MARAETATNLLGSPIRLTDTAVKMAKDIMQREGLANQGLRITVTSGGCSGLKYDMAFEPAPNDGDVVVEFDGLRVFVAELDCPKLEGVTVDYVSALQGAGFKFVNPRATRTCGCGESFAT